MSERAGAQLQFIVQCALPGMETAGRHRKPARRAVGILATSRGRDLPRRAVAGSVCFQSRRMNRDIDKLWRQRRRRRNLRFRQTTHPDMPDNEIPRPPAGAQSGAAAEPSGCLFGVVICLAFAERPIE